MVLWFGNHKRRRKVMTMSERRTKYTEKEAEYRRVNRELINAKARAKRAADPEAARVYQREWCKKNPDKVRAKSKRHAEKRAEAGRTKEQELKRKCLEHYGQECACCGEAERLF